MAEAEACIRRCAAVGRAEFGERHKRTRYLIGELGDVLLRRDGDPAAGELLFGEAQRQDSGRSLPSDPDHLFSLASAVARAATLVMKDEKSEETQFFAATYELSAFENLERAVAQGLRDPKRILSEPSLANLRAKERWKVLTSSLGR